MQEVHVPTRENAILDLVLASGDDLVGDVLVQESLEDNDHEMIQFAIQRKVGRVN